MSGVSPSFASASIFGIGAAEATSLAGRRSSIGSPDMSDTARDIDDALRQLETSAMEILAEREGVLSQTNDGSSPWVRFNHAANLLDKAVYPPVVKMERV